MVKLAYHFDVSPKVISADLESMRLAASHLIANGLVAMPTETVYGLAANAESTEAVQRIFVAKNRPRNHPLIVHIGSLTALNYWVQSVPEYALKLTSLWPGPITLVLPRSLNASDLITGNQSTVAVRMPNHPAAISLLAEFAKLGGRGVAAPSANRFGEVSATSASAVVSGIGSFLAGQDLIIDGGDCQVGIESTIVDCTGPNPALLRPGAITAEVIENVTGIVVAEPEGTVRAPGSHARHYSPSARVRVGGEAQSGWGLIALAEAPTPPGVVRLASPVDTEAYARELYAALRRADELGLEALVALPPSGSGLALAIRDRLSRAATQS